MAYIQKIIGSDEKLLGVARLHWIYVVRGLFWFFVLAGGGWLLDTLITRFSISMADVTSTVTIPYTLMRIGETAATFMMIGGVMVFFLFVIKVLTTEIGLTTRRVMHKRGWLFVKTNQVDLEEIRGETLDLGHMGRVLGYGYLMLDCRFIGDVRLPAIENAENFLRVLHETRAKGQDSLSIVMGKHNPIPVQATAALVGSEQQAQQPNPPQPAPEIMPPQPEIQPGQPGPQPEITPAPGIVPEIPTMPVPHNPPPAAPQPEPSQPPAQPTQPVPAPPPSEPPLQPPTDVQAAPVLDAAVVQQVVNQMAPQMAEQMTRELMRQGVIDDPANDHPDKDIDTALIESFDEAALDKDGKPRDLRNKLEHAIH